MDRRCDCCGRPFASGIRITIAGALNEDWYLCRRCRSQLLNAL
jgi:predicted SprT family Zn-dependent metalloprotease